MAQDRDVFKILKDLELKAVGLDPKTNKMQEGYFVAFRTIGLPIHKEDFENPFSPLGGHLAPPAAPSDPSDPKDAPKTGSGPLDEGKITVAQIGKAMQSYLSTFLLTDDKLRMNNEYSVMPGSSKVSDSWWAIITGANGIPTQSELSDDMKKSYEAAMAKLFDQEGNETPHYKAYQKFEQEYGEKVAAWNRAYAEAFTDPVKFQNWPIQGRPFHNDADKAMDRWMTFGFKIEIEQAMNILAARGTDPAIALIPRAKKRFDSSLLEFQGVGQIPYTILQPSTWYDRDNDDGWNVYGSSDFHSQRQYSASSTAYGGGGGFSLGFFSVGGKFDHTAQRKSLATQTQNLSVSFKYAIVDIKRPWLDTSLLNTRWFLVGDYKKNCVSTGKMAQELPSPTGEVTFLPSIVTSLVLIKDLSIKWDNFKSDWKSIVDANSGSAIGWGPFAVHGSYSRRNEETSSANGPNGVTGCAAAGRARRAASRRRG